MKVSDALGQFLVFKTKEGKVITINITRNINKLLEDAEIHIYDDDISPEALTYIGCFGVDGVSDYNWGIVNAVLDNNLTNSSAYNHCKEIERNGL